MSKKPSKRKDALKQAIELRVEGWDFTDIGEKTGLGDAELVKATLHKEVKKAVTDDERQLLKGVELIRLEKMHNEVFVNAKDDFAPRERIKLLLDISKERRALMGLDSPKSVDLTTKGQAIKGYIGISPDDWDEAEDIETVEPQDGES